MRYASKRQYSWSSNIAYSVGLMASDGCLQKDGRHLDLTSVDLDQLENFSRALGRNVRITNKGNKVKKGEKPAYRIQFSDVAYYDFLLETGLTPAKSKTIGALHIPEKFYADFLRGLFDGNGSCYAYMDKRWRSSYMFYVQFTSASLEFCQYIQRMNSSLAQVSAGSLNKSTRTFILSYAKADGLKLFNFMYHSPNAIYLSRKFTKLKGFTTYRSNMI